MRGITHNEGVCPIPHAARQHHVCTRPLVRLLSYPQVQGSARITPDVVSIVQIVQSAPSLRRRVNFPVVPAETKGPGGKRRQASIPPITSHTCYRPADGRRDLDGWGW